MGEALGGDRQAVSRTRADELLRIYGLLDDHFGDLHWWPADDPFEVMVGAILTQNTAWTNVERAIFALKDKGVLSPEAIASLDDEALANLIRPSGYYRVKAKRLKELVRFLLAEYGGSPVEMARTATPLLRDRLLAVRGVGPETADSILLYACEKPIFVVDAYTRRIMMRHGLIEEGADYEQVQRLFMEHLPAEVGLYNQYHALLVNAGKRYCRPTPRCTACPLQVVLPGRKDR